MNGPVESLRILLRGHEVLALWLGSVSLATLLGSLVLMPWLVVRIPSDYFAGVKRQPVLLTPEHTVARIVLLTAKTVLGSFFIIAGTAMLLLPGQGVLMILVGIMLMNFPGKFRAERWIVRLSPVIRSINWIRARAGREALQMAGDDGGPSSQPGNAGNGTPGETPC